MTHIGLTLVRLLLAPILVGLASLVSRLAGPTIGGWFAALPLTSGPVVLVLALDHGREFASQACVGISLALPALAAFVLAYAWSAEHTAWRGSTLLGCSAFLTCTVIARFIAASEISPVAAFTVACVALVFALCGMPRHASRPSRETKSARGIPLRMLLALALVWLLTEAAGFLGPRASGLLTPFPLVASLLAAFTHHAHGVAAVRDLLRGLLAGLFSFAVFFLVVGLALLPWGIRVAFCAGAVAALSMHALLIVLWRAFLSSRGSRSRSDSVGAELCQ